MTDYLTVAEVLAMHADQIERYGGSNGVRDQGLLEAALYRPQTGYYDGLIEEAAALWESLAQNHPFIDGNKRTAFAAAYTFLAINGARLTADPQEAYVFVAALYQANQFSFDKLVPWLRDHVTRGHETVMAMFELAIQGDEVKVAEEKHYRLVPSDEITKEDLKFYAGR
jgi:death-on-curing protein